jgi:hypothetical protein
MSAFCEYVKCKIFLSWLKGQELDRKTKNRLADEFFGKAIFFMLDSISN